MSGVWALVALAGVLAPGDLVIRHVTVVSAERDAPRADTDVVIRGERIAWVGALAEPTDGTTVLDGTGRYLVPGLIDGHVHLAALPGLSGAQAAAMPETVAAYFEQMPRSYLYFGFTTVVDVNVVEPALLARVRAADLAPEVLDCGGGVMVANGYPMLNRPAPERFHRYPNYLDATEGHAPEDVVARIAQGGASCVKAFYEPGPPSAPFPLPSLATMQALRDAAHRRRLPLLLHANSLEAHRFAVALSADAVAHGLWNWSGFEGGARELPPEVRALLDEERRLGLGYMATLRVMSSVADLFTPGFLDDPRLAKVLPPAFLAFCRSPAGRWLADETNEEGLPSEQIRALYRDGRQAAFTYMAGRGARLLFGSDTPSDATYANPPGYNGFLELRAMEQAGATPRQILQAATLENARFFGIDTRAGSVEPGKLANLLLLREDPLASTGAFDSLETVVLRGRVAARERLAAR